MIFVFTSLQNAIWHTSTCKSLDFFLKLYPVNRMFPPEKSKQTSGNAFAIYLLGTIREGQVCKKVAPVFISVIRSI